MATRLGTSEQQRDVVTAEPERVTQGGIDPHLAGLAADDVQRLDVGVRIEVVEVQDEWNYLVPNRQHREHRLHRT